MDAGNEKPDTGCNISVAQAEILRWKGLIKKHEKCRTVTKKYKVTRKNDVDKLLHRINTERSINYLTESNEKRKVIKETDKLDTMASCLENQAVTNNESTYDPYKPPAAFIDPGLDKYTWGSLTPIPSNIRRRIHIPKTNLDSIKGITDVDEKYFTIVKKDSTKPKYCVQSYINYLRDSLRLRLQTGYIFDEIYKLNEQSDVEMNKITEVRTKLKDYKMYFDEFLAEDHNQSMKPLLLFQERLAESDYKRQILTQKSNEISKAQFLIYSLEDAWQKSKLCEEFILSFFSILSGNDKWHYYNLKYNVDEGQLLPFQNVNSSILSILQFSSPKVNKELEIKLDDPSLLIEIFTSLEHQCLDYLMFTELLEKPNTNISVHLNVIKYMYNEEIYNVRQTVIKLTNVIDFIEQNNKSLEAHVNRLLHGLYKQTFAGAEESIVINEYLKQTYVRCITGSEASISSLQMMKTLALEYSQLLLVMDSVPSDLVRKRMKEVENRQTLKLKVARNAQRRIHELETLTQQMLRVFKPIPEREGRKLMHRSFRPTLKEKPLVVPEEMTEEEKEYLHLFTEFCPFTDNAKDFFSENKRNTEVLKSPSALESFIN